MSRTITIEYEGRTLYGKVARIKSTMLGLEDHGILTAYLHFDGDGWGIGVGGYGLDAPVKDSDGRFIRREPTAYGFDHVMWLMHTVGASKWEALPGLQAIVLFDSRDSWGATAVGIAHIEEEDRVFILKEHAEMWKARDAAEAVTA